MGLALLFNDFGIFLFLISPIVELWFNYKRGLVFKAAVKRGVTFEKYITGYFNKSKSFVERK